MLADMQPHLIKASYLAAKVGQAPVSGKGKTWAFRLSRGGVRCGVHARLEHGANRGGGGGVEGTDGMRG